MRAIISLVTASFCVQLSASVRIADVCAGVFGPVDDADQGICSFISGLPVGRKRRTSSTTRTPKPYGYVRLTRSSPWSRNLDYSDQYDSVIPMHRVKKRSVDAALKHTAGKRSLTNLTPTRPHDEDDKMDDEMREFLETLGEALVKMSAEEKLTDGEALKRAFVRIGRDPNNKRAFVRIGRNPEERKKAFMRLARAFVRIGRGDWGEPPSKKAFVRIGKNNDDEEINPAPEKKGWLRFGKRDLEEAPDKKGFIRFGRGDSELSMDKKAFMRFGKRDVESTKKMNASAKDKTNKTSTKM